MAEFVANKIFTNNLSLENIIKKSTIPTNIFSQLMSGRDKGLKDRYIPPLAKALHCQECELVLRINNIPVTTSLGALINNNRRQCGLTQTALAAKNGWPISKLRLLESKKKKIRHVDARTLTKTLVINPKLFIPFLSEPNRKDTLGNGEKMRLLRQSLLLSVSELARKLHLTKQTVSLYEHNDCYPSPKIMQKISLLSISD
jgi:transcriptional regulator with XRE-family HTH domain